MNKSSGLTNGLAFDRLMWFMPYCRRLVCLDGQIIWEKISFADRQISDDLFIKKFVCPICTSDNLSLSEAICPSRRFVRPLVWKRPLSWRLEDKIHFHMQACNILYISHDSSVVWILPWYRHLILNHIQSFIGSLLNHKPRDLYYRQLY